MKKILRKNQVIITTLAVLIAIAGYISFDRTNTLSDKDVLETNGDIMIEGQELIDTDIQEDYADVAMNTEADTQEFLNPGETVLTGATLGDSSYAASVKLNREQIRSKNKESLTEIINNESLTQEQKQGAIDQMVQLTEISEKEAAAEMLLEAKGFSDVVVSIGNNSCDVVLDMGDVTDAKRAQVEDIVKRKTGIAAENIVITPISK